MNACRTLLTRGEERRDLVDRGVFFEVRFLVVDGFGEELEACELDGAWTTLTSVAASVVLESDCGIDAWSASAQANTPAVKTNAKRQNLRKCPTTLFNYRLVRCCWKLPVQLSMKVATHQRNIILCQAANQFLIEIVCASCRRISITF